MAVQSLFGDSPTIGFPDNAEDTYSMATRITFAVDGTITGIRRWGTTNAPAGTPQGTIYSTAGLQLLTPVNFPAHTPNAWNTITGLSFSVTAGQTLDITAGPLSRYAGTLNVFSSPLVVGDLTGTAGRFTASGSLTFPGTGTTTWYGIDVLFEAEGGQTAPVGLVTETDSAFALARVKAKTLGLVSTVETAFSLGRAKARAIGMVLETDSAFGISTGLHSASSAASVTARYTSSSTVTAGG